jgi:hypothetical protein
MVFTIHLIGASHARRLTQPLTELAAKQNYKVVSHCTPGKPYRAIKWPDLGLVTKDDIVLLLLFGNDVNARECAERDRRTGKWHLLRFEPRSDRYFQIRFQELKEKLQNLPCKVFLCDNFYRLLCCEIHRHKNWISYQNGINTQIFEFFAKIDNITVVKHREIVGLDFKKKKYKDITTYIKLMYDSVHFASYRCIAQNLLNKMI